VAGGGCENGGMIEGNFGLALTTGMLVTINPCGFAMMPAYLGRFLADHDGDAGTQSTPARVLHALRVAGALSLGFLGVFLVVGILVEAGAHAIYSISQWLTIGVGLTLVAAGIAMLFGYRLPILTPKLERGGKDGSFQSMFLFGVSYAVASLGCSLGFFLGYSLSTASRLGLVSAAASFLVYCLGFAIIITALSLSLAFAQGWLLRGLRKAMRFVDALSAVFMILAGLYLAWYGVTEVRGKGSPITTWAADRSLRLQGWVADQGAIRIAVVLAVLVAAIVAAVLSRRSRNTRMA
jgi:cytochrome c-type biogenesis protein